METATIVRILYGHRQRQVVCACIAFLVALLAGYAIGREAWPLIAVCLLFVAACSMFLATEVDCRSRVVRRLWSLFGLLPLYARQFPLSEFSAIRARLRKDREGGYWMVALARKSGRDLDVSTFDDDPRQHPHPAVECARMLSNATGLPIAVIQEESKTGTRAEIWDEG